MFIFDPIYTALVGSDVPSYSSFPPAIHYTSSILSLSSVGRESSLPFSALIVPSFSIYSLYSSLHFVTMDNPFTPYDCGDKYIPTHNLNPYFELEPVPPFT